MGILKHVGTELGPTRKNAIQTSETVLFPGTPAERKVNVQSFTASPEHGPAFPHTGTTGISGDDAMAMRFISKGEMPPKPHRERAKEALEKRARGAEERQHGRAFSHLTEEERMVEMLKLAKDNPKLKAALLRSAIDELGPEAAGEINAQTTPDPMDSPKKHMPKAPSEKAKA